MSATAPFRAPAPLRHATDGNLETSLSEMMEQTGLTPSSGFVGRLGLAMIPLLLFSAGIGAGIALAYLSSTGRLR